MFYSRRVARFLDAFPGKKFGLYRYMPLFFLAGAWLEFTMINWRVGNINFYDTFKHRQAERLARVQIQQDMDKDIS